MYSANSFNLTFNSFVLPLVPSKNEWSSFMFSGLNLPEIDGLLPSLLFKKSATIVLYSVSASGFRYLVSDRPIPRPKTL